MNTQSELIAQPGNNFITDAHGIVICQMHRHHPDDKIDQIIKLFAASPKLLKVLEKFVTVMDDCDDYPNTKGMLLKLGDVANEARATVDEATRAS